MEIIRRLIVRNVNAFDSKISSRLSKLILSFYNDDISQTDRVMQRSKCRISWSRKLSLSVKLETRCANE